MFELTAWYGSLRVDKSHKEQRSKNGQHFGLDSDEELTKRTKYTDLALPCTILHCQCHAKVMWFCTEPSDVEPSIRWPNKKNQKKTKKFAALVNKREGRSDLYRKIFFAFCSRAEACVDVWAILGTGVTVVVPSRIWSQNRTHSKFCGTRVVCIWVGGWFRDKRGV